MLRAGQASTAAVAVPVLSVVAENSSPPVMLPSTPGRTWAVWSPQDDDAVLTPALATGLPDASVTTTLNGTRGTVRVWPVRSLVRSRGAVISSRPPPLRSKCSPLRGP